MDKILLTCLEPPRTTTHHTPVANASDDWWFIGHEKYLVNLNLHIWQVRSNRPNLGAHFPLVLSKWQA